MPRRQEIRNLRLSVGVFGRCANWFGARASAQVASPVFGHSRALAGAFRVSSPPRVLTHGKATDKRCLACALDCLTSLVSHHLQLPLSLLLL